MVASTANRKKAKMTYAERVLGAMSQIQREHKKHSVHIATLRAQIRKNATERKEKLGPQWSNWVSKAVTKLEEQGVLENAGSGNVAFTNEAKKALTTARRESAAFPSLSFGPTILDDAAIKAFTQKNFSRGVKRPRYSGVSGISFRPGAQNDEDDDDDDEPARSISVFSSPRRSQPKSKRARRSSIGGKVLSRMTRAELQAEVISLQEAALDNVEESAEATRLRLELESVKKQLTELENQRAAEVEPSELSDLSRLSTPEPGFNYAATPAPSSPLRPVEVPSTVRSRPSCGLGIRTESGSFINHYSKQPTPAPSMGDHDLDMTDYEAPCSPQGAPTEPNEEYGRPISHGLVTPPPSTPVRGTSDLLFHARDDELDTIREKYTNLVTEYEKLRADVSVQDSTIVTLRTEIAVKEKEIGDKQAELDQERTHECALTERVTDLEDQVRAKDAEVVEVGAIVRGKQVLLETLNEAKTLAERETVELRGTLEEKVGEVEETKRRLSEVENELIRSEAAKTTLVEEKTEFEKRFTEMEVELSQLKGQLEHSCTERENMAALVEELEAKVVEANNTTSQAQARVSELTELLRETEGTRDSRDVEYKKLLKEQELVLSQLEEAKIQVGTLEMKLSETLQELRESKEREEADREALARSDITHQEEVATLDALLTSLQLQLEESNSKADKLTQDLGQVSQQLKDLASEVTQREQTIETLTREKQDTVQQTTKLTDDRDRLAVRISELELTVDETAIQLRSREDQVQRLRAELVDKEEARARLETELTDSEARLASVRASLLEKSGEIANLRTQVTDLQQSEARLKDELKGEQSRTAVMVQEHDSALLSLKESVRLVEAAKAELASRLNASDVSHAETLKQLKATEEQVANLNTRVVELTTAAKQTQEQYEARYNRTVSSYNDYLVQLRDGINSKIAANQLPSSPTETSLPSMQ